MNAPLRILHFGLGPIGSSVARLVLQKKMLQIVGAVDIAEDKVGRDLSHVIGVETEVGVRVSNDPRRTLKETKPDIVVHCTSSFLNVIMPQLRMIMEAGGNVVSTAEELVYPFYSNPPLAEAIDNEAKQHNVTVLGTGVNPGFVMDTLAVILTAAAQSVDAVQATRIVDASKRRLPLQRKIGVNLTVEEFKQKASRGGFGHIGLPESAALIADAVGWRLQRVEQSIEPVVAERELRTEHLTVNPGRVAGLRQSLRGYVEGNEKITLQLEMSIDPLNPRDVITILGKPDIHVNIQGGLHGDLATSAIVVNMIPKVAAATPGLKTMKDLPLPSVFPTKL